MMQRKLQAFAFITTLTLVVGTVFAAHHEEPDAAGDPKAAEAAAGGEAKENATPGEQEAEGPTAVPTRDVQVIARTCKKTVASIAAGNLDAVKSADPDLQKLLSDSDGARAAYGCLAVAKDNQAYCGLLPDEKQSSCKDNFAMAAELKALGGEAKKPYVLYKSCLEAAPVAECQAARDAMAAGDPEKCSALTADWHRNFCAAVAASDATKCKGLEDAGQRGMCEAYATNDESRCPKDSADCRRWARGFKAFQAGGSGGLQAADPALAAANDGMKACAPSIAALEAACNGFEFKN